MSNNCRSLFVSEYPKDMVSYIAKSNYSAMVMAIAALSFLEPSGISDMGEYLGGHWQYIHMIFSVLRYVSLAVVVAVSARDLIRSGVFMWLLVGFQLYIFVMSLANGDLSFGGIVLFVKPLGVALLFYHCLHNENEDASAFLRVLQAVFELLIIINFISIVLHPNGMYMDDRFWDSNWFLGYKNHHIYYYMPYLLIASTVLYMDGRRLSLRFLVILAIMILASYLAESTTGIIAISICAALLIVFGNVELPRVISMRNVCIASLGVSIAFIFFNQQRLFSSFITDILGKDASFSMRTRIWSRAVEDFAQSPVLGSGRISYEGLFTTWEVSQMHNMFLDIAVIGGAVLLVIFLIIVSIVSKRVGLCANVSLRNAALFSFVGYAILFLMEARRDMTLLYAYLLICYCLPVLETRCGREKPARSQNLYKGS